MQDKEMSIEEKKEYLNSYRNVRKRIINLKEQLESLREVEQSAKVQRLSDMPKGGSGQQDLSDLMVQIEELRGKISDKIMEANRIRANIENTIASVQDADEARVLYLRYIEQKRWNEISEKMKYSYRQIHRIHGRALKKIKMAHYGTL